MADPVGIGRRAKIRMAITESRINNKTLVEAIAFDSGLVEALRDDLLKSYFARAGP